MRLLAANIPGMFGYWDRELRCRFANIDYARWFGLTPEQMLGMHAPRRAGCRALRRSCSAWRPTC